jgi:excisionase family DNA binding protein
VSPQPSSPTPRITYSVAEAAAALGVSDDFLRDHVLAELRVIRRGRLRLIPKAELDRWVEENAARVLPD